MLLTSLVVLPMAWLVSFFISFDIILTNALIYKQLDIILIIYLIGALFEIGDRFYIGIKKNKLVSIIRDKDDRH